MMKKGWQLISNFTNFNMPPFIRFRKFLKPLKKSFCIAYGVQSENFEQCEKYA